MALPFSLKCLFCGSPKATSGRSSTTDVTASGSSTTRSTTPAPDYYTRTADQLLDPTTLQSIPPSLQKKPSDAAILYGKKETRIPSFLTPI